MDLRAKNQSVWLSLMMLASCYAGTDLASEGASPGGAGGGQGTSGASDASDTGDTGEADGTSEVGLMPLRRLTREELNNTFRDLFGADVGSPADAFPAEVAGSSGFATAGLVFPVDAMLMLQVAETVATQARANLGALLPCDPAGLGEVECAEQFITRFGGRVFRRPLAPSEVEEFVALYDTARAELLLDFDGAIEVLIQAMLQSPRFLYRWELSGAPAQEDGKIRLGDHEIAARLSYFLWSTMPDDVLFTAAAAGELRTEAQVEAQARRMLADPRAQATLNSFHEQWLALDRVQGSIKDPGLYPSFGDEMVASMFAELHAFLASVILDGDGSWQTLMLAPYSFVDARLAGLYGLSGEFGDTPVKTDLDPTQRAGLVTMPVLMSATANAYEGSPFARGRLIREKFLCQMLTPPKEPVPELPPPSPDLPTRERYEEHTKDASCQGCHALINPPGFAFLNYDALGGWLTQDGGQPIDASGVLVGVGGGARPFTNAVDLATALVDTEEARQCISKQWFRFAFGRAETLADRESLDHVYTKFVESDLNLRELIVALTVSPSFRYRMPASGEVLQ